MEWNELKEMFEMGATEISTWLNNEYGTIRSGRVSLNVFDKVRVMAYGEEMKLNQVANIQIVSATQVLIKPYDRSQIQEILKGISTAQLNANPIVNPDSIRINFPAQTEENRKENVKRAKKLLEDAKVKIRDVRHEVQDEYKKLDGVSEDVIHYFEDELNKITKLWTGKLEQIYQAKEKELMSM
ncbi:MAG: ribosome recycling factor [Malacoplasma sp.]|nr:ribosome recycling factor [Malacoplasma sp.]